MEDDLLPLSPNVSEIRQLISSLELCHHKADRWVRNIVEAIGSEYTTKGLGTRSPGQSHPTEQIWQSVCEMLCAWRAGGPIVPADLSIGEVAASRCLSYRQ